MNKLIIPVLMIVALGCSPQKTGQIPVHIQELENLTVYPVDMLPGRTISFTKEIVYGDSDEILIGVIGDFAVDDLGRVFIADTRIMVLYAFGPDGRFITKLGRDGRGPGEFVNIKDVKIHGDYLYASDPSQSLVHVFALETLAGEKTVLLAGNRGRFPALASASPWIRDLYVRSDQTFIGEFIEHDRERLTQWRNIEVNSMFYLLDSNGAISEELFEYTREIRTVFPGTVQNVQPFFGMTLTVVSSTDRIYMAGPDYFLVKQYTPYGTYQQAWFYPVRRFPLTRDSAIEAEVRRDRYIDNMNLMNLPETWPVVTEMLIDNEDRLWVATTVEDMSIYEWWILEESGELIARFEWPRNKPIKVIRNNHIYTRETDDETGLRKIVRFRFEYE